MALRLGAVVDAWHAAAVILTVPATVTMRDRSVMARYEEEIRQIRRHLEELEAARAELERLPRGN